jgi:hypothetical protein
MLRRFGVKSAVNSRTRTELIADVDVSMNGNALHGADLDDDDVFDVLWRIE